MEMFGLAGAVLGFLFSAVMAIAAWGYGANGERSERNKNLLTYSLLFTVVCLFLILSTLFGGDDEDKSDDEVLHSAPPKTSAR
jgi:hypothetical protein